jgi:hypothetical protein
MRLHFRVLLRSVIKRTIAIPFNRPINLSLRLAAKASSDTLEVD